eukprot:SAG11_NODE_5749_length_1472_cov_3.490896_1_plen_197_part_00
MYFTQSMLCALRHHELFIRTGDGGRRGCCSCPVSICCHSSSFGACPRLTHDVGSRTRRRGNAAALWWRRRTVWCTWPMRRRGHITGASCLLIHLPCFSCELTTTDRPDRCGARHRGCWSRQLCWRQSGSLPAAAASWAAHLKPMTRARLPFALCLLLSFFSSLLRRWFFCALRLKSYLHAAAQIIESQGYSVGGSV